MELSVLAAQAVKIALRAIDKASDGALKKAGADVLDLLKKRFQGKLSIKEAEPEMIEAAIVSEAERDLNFQQALEKLVNHYQQVQSTTSVSQNTKSGVNVSVSGNAGTVIGQQIENKFFR